MKPQPKLRLIVLIGLLVMFVGTVSVYSHEIKATNITVTAYPSAYNNLEYKQYTTTFENYCPLCGHNNTLTFNPKGTFEGELTCSNCGADYCAVTGKDKSYNCRATLKEG